MLDLDELLSPGSYDGPDGPVLALPKGDVTIGVVRIGGTVRRPRQPQSRAVAGYLLHLQREGFNGAPRFLGTDREGRDVLDFIPGTAGAQNPEAWLAEDDLLRKVADLVRRLLDASQGYPLHDDGAPWFRETTNVPLDAPTIPETPDVVGHCDITPQNVIFTFGRVARALVDFDLAGPTTRLGEARNLALHWAPLVAPQDRPKHWHGVDPLARTCLIADALQLTPGERQSFVRTNQIAAQRSWHLMHANAVHLGGGWARMWQEGVGERIRRRQRWLDEVGSELESALTR